MREIKFRQPLRFEDGTFREWIYWGFIDSEWRQWAIQMNGQETRHESQQYTGLEDKNGKEIYEGDVVRTTVSSEWDEEVPRNEIGTVETDGLRWWVKSEFTADEHNLTDFRWTVIGNIYENPELLEANK